MIKIENDKKLYPIWHVTPIKYSKNLKLVLPLSYRWTRHWIPQWSDETNSDPQWLRDGLRNFGIFCSISSLRYLWTCVGKLACYRPTEAFWFDWKQTKAEPPFYSLVPLAFLFLSCEISCGILELVLSYLKEGMYHACLDQFNDILRY